MGPWQVRIAPTKNPGRRQPEWRGADPWASGFSVDTRDWHD
jgi:hypothetical protein